MAVGQRAEGDFKPWVGLKQRNSAWLLHAFMHAVHSCAACLHKPAAKLARYLITPLLFPCLNPIAGLRQRSKEYMQDFAPHLFIIPLSISCLRLEAALKKYIHHFAAH